MNTSLHFIQIAGLYFILQIVCVPLPAAQVSIQKVHEEPKTVNEDPQDFVRMTIDGKGFRCALLGDWGLVGDTYGYDVAAIPPNGASGLVAVRVETCVDNKGKPFTQLTKELLDAQIKRLKPEGTRCEGEPPALQDGMTTVEFDLLRVEETGSLKCHYRFSMVEDHLWTFVCQAPPAKYPPVFEKFCILSGTFSKEEKEPPVLSFRSP
ncbi:MAG: hypothetical protein HY360_01785 [Verrucomicrobia bacterium]|nr:hypothetical protein [Verrucomicrobiota bacterium]